MIIWRHLTIKHAAEALQKAVLNSQRCDQYEIKVHEHEIDVDNTCTCY